MEKVKYAIRGLYVLFMLLLIYSFCSKIGVSMEEYVFECTSVGIVLWYVGQKVLCRGVELFNNKTK
jgi:hypothetical protein